MSAPSYPGNQPLLVGRERELAVLRDHLSAALNGRGSVVLIGGEAGIGKTALAETLCHEAVEQGALVLTGRSFDLAETAPFGPWIDLFAHYHPTDGLPPPPAPFAEWGTVGAVSSQGALFHAVLDFLTALAAQHPLVVLLEDTHWQDGASLDLLRFLGREIAAFPILLLVTYRSDELTRRAPLYQLLPVLERESRAVRLDLRRLSPDAVRALIIGRYPLAEADIERLVAWLEERAGGNAFFTLQLLRALEEDGVLRDDGDGWMLGNPTDVRLPVAVRQVIDSRVLRLDEESQRLLAIAAVIGQDVPLAVWAAVAQRDEQALLETAEHAVGAHLIAATSDGAGVQFIHALVRQALYESIFPLRRRFLHRQVGEALIALPYPDPDAVAFHLRRSDDPRALGWLMQAGERAQAAYAWQAAAERFAQALALMEQADGDVGERAWLLMRLSRLVGYADVARGHGFAGASLVLAQQVDDCTLAAYARFRCGLFACYTGDVARGLPEMEAGAEALAALSAAERSHFAAHAAPLAAAPRVPEGYSSVAVWKADVGRFHEARLLAERVTMEAEAAGEEAVQSVRDGYHALGYAYAALGMPDAATTVYTNAHDVFLRGVHFALASFVSSNEVETVTLVYQTEDLARRRWLMERAGQERERAHDSIPLDIPPRFLRLPLLVLEGYWEEAESLAAVGSAEERGVIQYRGMALRYCALLARLRGDTERAWWAIGQWLPAGSETEPGMRPMFTVVVALQQVAAALALDAGDVATAAAWLNAHDRWLAWSGVIPGRSEGLGLWARYYQQVGDFEQGYEYAEHALALATAPRQPLALIAAHRLIGALQTARGNHNDACAHLEASLSLTAACAAPYERALSLLILAELHAATGKHDDARAAVREARAICEPIGARPALARAGAIAARLTTHRPAASTYSDGLTKREVEVLRLLARGKTSQEVADILSLSPRTVERHITGLYRKIAARGRAEATVYALRHGLLVSE